MYIPRRFAPLFLCLAALASADQVVLKNGDTITGSIIKKDGAKLTLKSEFLGEVTMPWTAVQSIRSDETLTVVMPNGESVAGKVSTSGDTLQVAAPSGPKTTSLASVQTLRNPAEQHAWERLQHPGILELWTGSYDMGLALARGNAHTDTFTNSFNADRTTTKDKITVSFNQIYGTSRVTANGISVTDAVANAVRGGWTYRRNLTPRFFVGTLNTYEHDQLASLDLRFVAGGGLGIDAVKNEKTTLSLAAGGDYQRENFTTLKRNSGEVNFGDSLTYKISSASSIIQTFFFFPNLTRTGEYRANFDLSAVTAVKKWLGWHVTVSDRFVSDPLAGKQKNDLLLSTGFRLSFGK